MAHQIKRRANALDLQSREQRGEVQEGQKVVREDYWREEIARKVKSGIGMVVGLETRHTTRYSYPLSS